ncbi:MAG: hypothetical protein KGJ13_07150 [Patescibacteria group bacterium]|nr:hypothetical protein [Patescibacteria group bacterium]
MTKTAEQRVKDLRNEIQKAGEGEIHTFHPAGYFTPADTESGVQIMTKDGIDPATIQVSFVHRVDLGGLPWMLYFYGKTKQRAP